MTISVSPFRVMVVLQHKPPLEGVGTMLSATEGLLSVDLRLRMMTRRWKSLVAFPVGTDLFIGEFLQGRTKSIERLSMEWSGSLALRVHRFQSVNP